MNSKNRKKYKKTSRESKLGSQISFYIPESPEAKVKYFGGNLLKGNAKTKRPLSTKSPTHIVMRSSLARGAKSFLNYKHSSRIYKTITQQAKCNGIKIFRYENVGNHIHLVVLISHRKLFFKFIRSISGIVARIVLGCERGPAKKTNGSNQIDETRERIMNKQPFWDARPFTRIVEWGQAYKKLLAYMDKNALQAIGFDLRSLETVKNISTPIVANTA